MLLDDDEEIKYRAEVEHLRTWLRISHHNQLEILRRQLEQAELKTN